MAMKPCACLCCVVASRVWFHRARGPRSSGVTFFCFVSPRAWKQKKPTPLDRGPPLHVNRPLGSFYTCCHAYGHVILPGTIMTKHHFFITHAYDSSTVTTVANRGDYKNYTIPVGTDVYVCLPYTITVKKQKAKKGEERKKKQTIIKKNNQ